MKTLPCLLISLFQTVCLSAVSAEPANVAFAIGKQEFKPGDGIVIDQVRATSSTLKAGDKVTVRGHYLLASAPKASLGLFVTHRAPAGPDKTEKSQMTQVESAGGAFELSCEITYEGNIHVSFYSVSDGQAFGGVYFTVGSKNS